MDARVGRRRRRSGGGRARPVGIGLVAMSADYPLKGVRLGRMERWLLLNASDPTTAFGFVLEPPDSSTGETLRRAVRKLEHLARIEVHQLRTYVRARDPRRGVLSSE